MVRAKVGLEADRLGVAGEGEDLLVREALLRLGHQRESQLTGPLCDVYYCSRMNELVRDPAASESATTAARRSVTTDALDTADRRALTESVVDGLIGMYARKLRAKARPSTWHGTSMAHFVVLSQLAEGDGLPMTTLARTLDVSLPSMTGIADRMASHGLVERVRDPDDRRVVRCRLTGAGRDRLAAVESMQRDRIACVLGQLERLDISIEDLAGAFAAAEACGDLERFDQHSTTTEEVQRP